MAIELSSGDSGFRSFERHQSRYKKWMRNRIKELLKERRWTNDQLAEKIGAHTTTVSRLINQRILLGEDWLMKLANAFGVSPEEILAEIPNVRMVPVIGPVQAGTWSETWKWPEEDQVDIPVPDDAGWRGLHLSAAETRGPSMNLCYPEGTIVVFNDHVESGEALITGRRYVIERERRDGLCETTVKTLWQDPDTGKRWLRPESNDPRFQQLIAVEGEDGDLVRILGRVVYVVRREE